MCTVLSQPSLLLFLVFCLNRLVIIPKQRVVACVPLSRYSSAGFWFPVSGHAYATARRLARDLHPGATPLRAKQPACKQPTSQTNIASIRSFLTTHSSPASNRRLSR